MTNRDEKSSIKGVGLSPATLLFGCLLIFTGIIVAHYYYVQFRMKLVSIDLESVPGIVESNGRLTESVGMQMGDFADTNCDFGLIITNGVRVPATGSCEMMSSQCVFFSLYRGTNSFCTNNHLIGNYRFWSEAPSPYTMHYFDYVIKIDAQGQIKLAGQGLNALRQPVAVKYEKIDSKN